jgi:hypothetical protein
MSIEQVVQQQIEFYNQQDIEGFASTYADDITVYTFPDNHHVEWKTSID